jgi:hypothetical protein
MPRVSGGCLCGRIRYSGEAESLRMVACHFKNCQRFTGSAFLTVFAFPKDMITLTGDRGFTPNWEGQQGCRCIACFARIADRRP